MTAHPWLHELPWPKKKLPREKLEARIERVLTMDNMGVLATSGEEGAIASPIEYYSEGLAIYLFPQPGSPKIRAMQRDPRICFAVYLPMVGWASIRGAQLFGKAQLLEPGTPEHEYGLTIYRWQSSAIQLGRTINDPPQGLLLKLDPDKVVYTEHWIRREGYAPRQIWLKNPEA